MCIAAPVIAATAAVVSATASLASIGMSVSSANQQARAAKKRGEYENKVALYNAAALKNSGRVEQLKQGIAQRREFGRKRAQFASLDVDISYGNAARRLDETRKFHAMDSSILARNVQARVLGARMQGDAALYNSKVDAQDAKLFGVAGAIRGVGGLASSINSFANSGVLDNFTGGADDAPPVQRRSLTYSPDQQTRLHNFTRF